MSQQERSETEPENPPPAKPSDVAPTMLSSMGILVASVVLGLIVGSRGEVATAGAIGGLACGGVLILVLTGVRTSRWSETLHAPTWTLWIFLGIPISIFFFIAPPCCCVAFPFWQNLCACRLESEVSSPDGSRRAITFTFDCGAASAFGRGVTILALEEPLPERRVPPLFYYVSDPRLEPEVRWASNHELVISGVPTEGADVALKEFAGVSIRYDP